MVADATAADRCTSSIEQFVAQTIAVACRTDPARIGRDTALLDLQMDSLTLAAVLSQVEAAFAVDFSSSDLLDLLSAANVGDLVAGIERRVSPRSSA